MEECEYWRSELAKLKAHDWIKAMYVMQQITKLSNNRWGPSGAIVAPRACSVCDYFGHSKRHCAVWKERQARLEAEALERDDIFALENEGGEALAALYDAERQPFVRVPGLGVMWSCVGLDTEHAGKWTFDAEGRVVHNSP